MLWGCGMCYVCFLESVYVEICGGHCQWQIFVHTFVSMGERLGGLTLHERTCVYTSVIHNCAENYQFSISYLGSRSYYHPILDMIKWDLQIWRHFSNLSCVQRNKISRK